MTDRIGLRELRQQASEIIREVEAGKAFEVTVTGRPAARLLPIVRTTTRSPMEVADLWDGQDDPSFFADLGAAGIPRPTSTPIQPTLL